MEQSPDVEEPGTGEVATYYPGALDPAGRRRLSGPGERVEGMNIRLRRERVYGVSAGSPRRCAVWKVVMLSFESEVEPDDDWDDGTGWMGSLISLRGDLLRGDFRLLLPRMAFQSAKTENSPTKCWNLPCLLAYANFQRRTIR